MGILGALFGGGKNKSSSSSTSESGNKAYDAVSGQLAPVVSGGANVFSQLSNILTGGGGFEDFKRNSGYDFLYNKGTRDIAGGAAAKGLLNSGSTAKALASFEGNLGSTMYGNWLDRLGKLSELGIGASAPIVSAGQWSKGTAESKGKGTDYGKGIVGTLFG